MFQPLRLNPIEYITYSELDVLYKKRMNAVTERAFYSIEIQVRREVVIKGASFMPHVRFTASAPAVQIKRPIPFLGHHENAAPLTAVTAAVLAPKW
jgi:hypothetical protein